MRERGSGRRLILNSLEKSVVLREADAETDQRYAEAVDAECEMIAG